LILDGRIDAWLDTSRLNPRRLLVAPLPALAPDDVRAFDALLRDTPEGAEVRYDLPQPRWWFLHHAVARGYLLHGSNDAAIDVFRTRATYDAHGAPTDSVFASDDAIWPLYFAVVNRPVAQSYINWCVHVRGEARFLFSIGSDPTRTESWTRGAVYLLPRETFTQTPRTREFVSDVAVRPRARLTVEPDDFPFRNSTLWHARGDSPRRVVMRNALSWPWLRSRALADSRQRGA
jgi:hypothetical protein